MKHIVLAFLLYTSSAFAQDPVEYEISFDNAIHHEAKVSVLFRGLDRQPLEVRMSRSSPGRYSLHEFAKNVYNVQAYDGKGNKLSISRPNPHQWNIPHHDGTVRMTYILYGDHANGTYDGIDQTHARLNIPASFMWARGLESRPVRIAFKVPRESGWKIATQLFPTHDSTTFTASDLQYFMDCPTELSPFTMREWRIPSGDSVISMRMAIHDKGTDADADAFEEIAKRIVYEERAIFGEFPRYDHATYTFIVDYLPYVFGDGMEHRNSTFITGRRPIHTNAIDNTYTLSHEFFHSWNVERLRPKSLEPFNFEESNMSGELWFAEGFTNYYGELVLHRAKITSIDRYARDLSGAMNSVLTSPGREYASLVEMSERAPFVDGTITADEQNIENIFISYYSYGEAIALALDIMLRTQYPGASLDKLMQVAWQMYGKTEKPYTNEDIRNLLATLTNDRTFADQFFEKYVYGRELPEYEKLLAHAGFLLRKAKEKKASFGRVSLKYEDGKTIMNGATLVGSPLYEAGLDRNDTIVSADGRALESGKDVDSVLARHMPGDKISLDVRRRDGKRTITVNLCEKTQMEVVPYEHASLPITDEIRKFREDWLGSKAAEKLPEMTKWCPTCKRDYVFPLEYCSFDGDTLRVVREERK